MVRFLGLLENIGYASSGGNTAFAARRRIADPRTAECWQNQNTNQLKIGVFSDAIYLPAV
ncbi:hypothetical protein QKW52_28795 [Bacillus sonorensis]|nr:hypothetical protein [Bacillus sonorensis]